MYYKVFQGNPEVSRADNFFALLQVDETTTKDTGKVTD